MTDFCANKILHNFEEVDASTTILNNGKYRICDICRYMFENAKNENKLLCEFIELIIEEKPIEFNDENFIQPSKEDIQKNQYLNYKLNNNIKNLTLNEYISTIWVHAIEIEEVKNP